MNVVKIMCIKDEEDLIYPNLKYHYNIGFRIFYIMFNNSNEKTRKEVDRFDKNHELAQIKRFNDENPAYLQPTRFTMMANAAHNEGSEWIVAGDADEIIRLTRHKTIQEYLQCFEPTDPGYIQCRWIDYQATECDDKTDANVFTRWKYREKQPRDAGKIILKWSPRMRFGDGNHLITTGRLHIATSSIAYYAHFPNRTPRQLKKKIDVIGNAFIKTFGEDSDRPQVKMYHRLKKEGDVYFNGIWKDICDKRTKNWINYVHDPIDPSLFT